jgi:hypothetical protein
VVSHLVAAMNRGFGGGDPSEAVALARLACAVGEEDPRHAHFSDVLRLLDLYDEHIEPPDPTRRWPPANRLLVVAMTVARTPDVPVPDLPEAPEPTRAAAERGDRG